MRLVQSVNQLVGLVQTSANQLVRLVQSVDQLVRLEYSVTEFVSQRDTNTIIFGVHGPVSELTM
jgi:hypothetical protein